MRTSASLPIGTYNLDMPIEGIKGLTEFSQTEYAIIGRQFQGEKNYNAPGLAFLKRHWKVALGTVGGKVYKIALYFDSKRKDEVIDASMEVMEHCQQWLGQPSEQHDTIFIWDTSDGNVVLQFGKALDTYQVNLFETSGRVKNFRPKLDQ